MRSTCTTLLGLLLCATAGAQIETQPVTKNILMITGGGGNVAVSTGPDGMLLVDDKLARFSEPFIAEVQKLQEKHGKLAYVLNTHYHYDHTGTNPHYGKVARIIAHDNVRVRLSTLQVLNGQEVQPLPPEGLPVITFEHGLKLHFNGDEVRVRHMPGAHTDGDSVVHFVKANVIHMGDMFFMGKFPFVDLDHGGSVQGLTKHIGTLLDELPKDIKVVPGHGPLASLDDLRSYHKMLEESLTHIRKQLNEGKRIDEIRAAGLPDWMSSFDGGYIKADAWITTVVQSIARANDFNATP